jgi:hypothetical protein
MAIVSFDPTAFKIRYPAFAGVADAMLTACFNDAGFYLSNSDGSPVQDVGRRERLLWMVTAHIAYLGGALSADGLPRPVGIMTSATEGSVSIGIAAPTATPGSGEWFKQTQWGAQFWQATTALRGFRWVC